jgi:GNAT superfamily N-acetyltransferase
MREFKPFTIEVVTAQVLHDLRRTVLRGGDPSKSVADVRDDDVTSLHLAGLLDGRVVASGSFYPAPAPMHDQRPSYQLRYLATDVALQGRGAGSLLLRAAESRLASLGAEQFWANARDTALVFYHREGWTSLAGSEHLSEETNLPHTVVAKQIRRDEPVSLGWADADDAAALADLREEMFFSMALRQFAPEWIETSTQYFSAALADGSELAAIARTNGGEVVSSAVASIRSMPPVPNYPRGVNAYVHSVSTLPGFRRRGISRRLMEYLLDELRRRNVERAELHATAQGESVYRALGFVERTGSPEMRLDLDDGRLTK